MAVGENCFPHMEPVPGIELGTACAGIKQQERDDLLVLALPEGTACAAVFTQNAFCAAPVHIAKDHLQQNPRLLIINSGNANAGTGEQGMDDALAVCRLLAEQKGVATEQVLPFSTGVIGENLDLSRFERAIPKALSCLSEKNWEAAARAIMTTDTRPKGASVTVEIDGHPVVITGISKGSGMILPNMATMLAFIMTDAHIDTVLLQESLQEAVNLSFNAISVDGDTSTNDACLIAATSPVEKPQLQAGSDGYKKFLGALKKICKELAEAIVRDGEGATRLIRVQVNNALSDNEARMVAQTVALSPLVKTAVFAGDPNWGRILAAVGRAGVEPLELDKLKIYLNDVCIVEGGGRSLSYSEAAGQDAMAKDEIAIKIDLARGECCFEMLGCDLSYDYVRINAEYRT